MNNIKKKPSTKRRRFGRIVKYTLLVLVVLLIINITPSFFYKPETNTNPLPSYYKKGVYHMHSVFSDGKGTIHEITRAAAALNLDFVILTDHGRPNIQSSTSTSRLNNVLVIGGTEMSLYSGHLAAVGFNIPDYIFPPEPQEAINEIINDNENGVCFISHPFDDKIPWTDWDISRFTGLEILSSYSEARRTGIIKALIFPLKYMINSKYALLNTMSYPGMNIDKWDSLNRAGRYYGIFALDAHAKLPISKKIQLNFPSYKSMFEILTVYVKSERGPQPGEMASPPHETQTNPKRMSETTSLQAASDIISSLKKGNFFNVIEAIAPANGFDAFFIEKNSGHRVEMGGSTIEKQGKLVILLPFHFNTKVKIVKDGTATERMANKNDKRLDIDISEPGVYRIEVYVPGNTFADLPWIMTNPFFVGVSAPLPSPLPPPVTVAREWKSLPDDNDGFKVEKNSSSQGAITYEISEEKEKILRFTFKLLKDSVGEKDFWSAIALRRGYDFSGYQGFVFDVKSDQKRRFWVEFRTGEGDSEIWYRHSFLVKPEWQRINIPFNKFRVIFGERRIPNLSTVSAIFFAINNANAYPGTEGELYIKNFGIY